MGITQKKSLSTLAIGSIIIILCSFLIEYIYTIYLNDNWDRLSIEEASSQKKYIEDKFKSYQQEISEALIRFSKSPEVTSSLNGNIEEDRLFKNLSANLDPLVSIELFNDQKKSVAWSNDYLTSVGKEFLTNSMQIIIQHKSLFTHLVITLPIIERNEILGYIVGKRLFEVNLPLSNRFINENTFTSTFQKNLKINPEYYFRINEKFTSEKESNLIPLVGLNNKLLGYAILPLPVKEDYILDLLKPFRIARGAIIVLIFGIGIIFFLKHIQRLPLQLRVLLISLWIWSIRYLLLWWEFPKLLFPDLFTPEYFASPFGFGIASSLGETLITSIFLFINAMLVFISYNQSSAGEKVLQSKLNVHKKIVSIISMAILSLLLFISFRATASIFRSAVRDSSVSFNNLSSLLPSSELSILLLSLFLIVISIIIIDNILIRKVVKILREWKLNTSKEYYYWIITFLLLFFGGIIFGMSQKTPLINYETRSMLILAFVFISYKYEKWLMVKSQNKIIPIVITTIIISILWIIPSIRYEMEMKERGSVEYLAKNILKPMDAWLNHLLTETLEQCTDDYSSNLLSNGRRTDYASLAFEKWAKGFLSSEGNNCFITYYNDSSRILSSFQIGGYSLKKDIALTDEKVDSTDLNQIEITMNGTSIRWLVGSKIIRDKKGNRIGFVRVGVTGSKQTFLRGEVPDVLKTSNKDTFAGLEQPLIFSEYFNKRLTASSDEIYFTKRKLAQHIEEQLSKKSRLWNEEEIQGKKYESFYFRDDSGSVNTTVYSLSRLEPDLFLTLFWFIRIISVPAIIILFCLSIYLLLKRITGTKIRFQFNEKLLISYLLVATIPVLFLGYYNKQSAESKTENELQTQLQSQTEIVKSELVRAYGLNTPASISKVYDTECANLADEINTDLDIYNFTALSATSKPELYDSELLDSHIDASAYRALFIDGRNFYSQKEQLGSLIYVVGYRPLYADDGRVIGAISVPTLFRQSASDKEMVQSNAALISIYVLGFIISIILGYILSKQFGTPIKTLISATREISNGNLSYKRKNHRNDELGELDQAFEQMSTELRNKQEQLVTAQREAAWREMAKQVAHEIKNPLTPMKLSVQHLRTAFHDEVKNFKEVFDKVTTTILEQIETLSRIATEFSHMAKMPSRYIEEISIHDILVETKNLFSNYENVEFRLELNAKNFVVRADRDELRRALVNIVKNSVQALNESGVINLITQNNNDEIIMMIKDNGPGMNEETFNRLFEVNFSTKSEGMGIGLAMVKKTINDLQGRVDITNVLGQGVQVKIALPLAKK
ncbi:MAG: HAMP domain-containing protein [Ignavibacteriales bacterium]|nr:HAMP domain-containing protein [Ignavibacteriales bacterium]